MPNQASILDDIVATKRLEVCHNQAKVPLSQLQAQIQYADPPRGFEAKLAKAKPFGVIAEIKKASPSKGIINQNFNPKTFAQQYQQAGACCLSVLTDEHYFQGNNSYLQQARGACRLPVLRKDFIIDIYQVYESRVLGADCILLIAACLTDSELFDFHHIATNLGMDVLIEVHNKNELERALLLKSGMIGINNRDLRTFNVSLNTTLSLLQYVDKDRLLVTESGIQNTDDIDLMLAHGVSRFLIGEQFMKANNPGNELKKIFNHFQ